MFSSRGLAGSVLAIFVAVFVLGQPHHLALGGDQVVILDSGTPVFVVFPRSVDSDSAKEGDLLQLRVLMPVKVNGQTLIRAGEKVSAKVIKSTESGGWGKKGELEVQIDSTTAVDGQEVFLQSSSARREGEGKTGTATAVGVGLGILCLPLALVGFAVKGEEGRFPAGYELKSFVGGKYTVDLAKAEVLSPAEEQIRARELQEEIARGKLEEKMEKKEETTEEEKKEKEDDLDDPFR